ncbi:MAG: hypothetical protein ACRCZF_18670, partial [Gemmataceae bacterium]
MRTATVPTVATITAITTVSISIATVPTITAVPAIPITTIAVAPFVAVLLAGFDQPWRAAANVATVCGAEPWRR